VKECEKYLGHRKLPAPLHVRNVRFAVKDTKTPRVKAAHEAKQGAFSGIWPRPMQLYQHLVFK
jgi:hypothetical protein